MDKEFWDKFNKYTNAFERSAQYQAHCWNVYKENKDIILEFIKWRDFLNLRPDSNEDAGLAYLVYCTHKYHFIKWKSILKGIMEEIIKLPPDLFRTYILLLIKEYQIQVKTDEIAGKEKRVYPDEILKKNIEDIKEYIIYLKEKLKDGKVMFLRGPPTEYYPAWYLIAKPEHEFYKNEKLERVIKPLIEHEKKEDLEKIRIINKLGEYLTKHTWQPFYDKQVTPILTNLKNTINNELSLRNDVEKELDINEVNKLNVKIKDTLNEQANLIKGLRENLKSTNIPSKKIHEEVYNLLNELDAILLKEKS